MSTCTATNASNLNTKVPGITPVDTYTLARTIIDIKVNAEHD
jgi:hypothetical protein